MTTDLIMWSVPKPLSQRVAPKCIRAGLVTSYKSLSIGTQQYFRVHWDTLVVHESSGLESYKG